MSAHAGAPFVTDDPEPVDLHHAEINLAFQRTRSDAASSGSFAADMNWGCARDTQCHVAVPLAFATSGDTGRQSGLGDVEIGAKYRFLGDSDSGVMAAVYPTLFLPSGSAARGLGNGRLAVLLPVWLQKSAGPWIWGVGAGYTINHAPGARSSWFTGLLLRRSLTDRFSLGAELFHRTATAEDTPRTTGFNVGAVIKLSGHANLLASIGRGLQGMGENRGSLYLAYQLEL